MGRGASPVVAVLSLIKVSICSRIAVVISGITLVIAWVTSVATSCRISSALIPELVFPTILQRMGQIRKYNNNQKYEQFDNNKHTVPWFTQHVSRIIRNTAATIKRVPPTHSPRISNRWTTWSPPLHRMKTRHNSLHNKKITK